MERSSQPRRCPICDRDEADLFLTKGSLQLVQCRNCSMIYANPVAAEFATGTFYDRRGTTFYLSPEKLESDYAPVRFERELRIFRRYCRRGAVLDVGCSTGAFLFHLKTQFPQDYTVHGTDVTNVALDYAESRGVQVQRGSFLDLKFQPEFDAVCFWAVMEHLVNPRQFLERAEVILRPGGSCFILVPNMRSLAVRLLGAKYRYIMPDHVNYFTKATLERLAESAGGFGVLAMTTTHFNPMVILKDLRARADRVPDEERAELLKRTTAWKQNRWLRPIKTLYRGVERALASGGLADNLVVVLEKKKI